MPHKQLDFTAIGTKWSIGVSDSITDKYWRVLTAEIRRTIEKFDKNYSRFRPDSLVTELSRKAGSHPLPHDGYKLFSFYKKIYDVSAGMVTPLIGQLMSDAGYDAKYSFKPTSLASPPAWEEVLDFDENTIRLKRPVLLDFGAAGKGYLVDILNLVMEDFGFHDYFIDAGGDILQRSQEGEFMKVGLESPLDLTQVIGVARLSNQSLCASSGLRRRWGSYHHIMNPKTLEPANDVSATWVIADDTLTADGMATALFFVPPVRLKDFKFSYAVLTADMALTYSPDFPADIFKAVK